jgi:hypothetical protein
VVRAETGEPVAGALVMGLNLAYAETAADGSFTLRNPELALFFWCVGYYPRTHVLNGAGEVQMTLRPVRQSYVPSTR